MTASKYILLIILTLCSAISVAQSKKYVFITASDIDSFNKYGNLVAALKSMQAIESVIINQLENHTLSISLTLTASYQHFLDEIIAGEKLIITKEETSELANAPVSISISLSQEYLDASKEDK